MGKILGHIAFRVDASPVIGYGHWMRCLTLADALSEAGAQIHFIAREFPEPFEAQLEARAYSLHRLKPRASNVVNAERAQDALGCSEIEDAQETAELVKDAIGSLQWLIADHYGIGAVWEREVRPLADYLGVIDDLHNRSHEVDWLLDQNAGHTVTDYMPYLSAEATVLTGSAYALVRSEFAQHREEALRRRKSAEFKRLLVFFSGTPQKVILEKSLKALSSEVFRSLSIEVITGDALIDDADLNAWAQRGANVTLKAYEPNMASALLNADCVLGAAGASSWERCVLGVPTVGVSLAENQLSLAHFQQTHGNLIYLGEADHVSEVLIRDTLLELMRDSALLKQMSDAALALCDGRGRMHAVRTLARMPDKTEASVGLRPFKAEDVGMLFDWQSVPSTRQYAHNPEPPEWESHKAWFAKRLNDAGSSFMIVRDGETVGMLRSEWLNEGGWLVSLLVSPEHYGKGIARSALAILTQTHLDIHPLVAEIHPDNTASKRVFESVGFCYDGERFIFQK